MSPIMLNTEQLRHMISAWSSSKKKSILPLTQEQKGDFSTQADIVLRKAVEEYITFRNRDKRELLQQPTFRERDTEYVFLTTPHINPRP